MSKFWPLIKLLPIRTNFQFVKYARLFGSLSILLVIGSIFFTVYPADNTSFLFCLFFLGPRPEHRDRMLIILTENLDHVARRNKKKRFSHEEQFQIVRHSFVKQG